MIFRLQFHSTRRVHHSGGHLEFRLSIALQGLLGHLQECFLHRGTLHGTGFVKEHVVVFTRPLFAACTGHLPLRLLVQLVADADEGERLGVLRAGILIEAISPAAQSIEAGRVSDVVDECAAIRASVKRVAQRLELLLSRSVPDLKCHHRVIY